ncbi:acyl-CoA binding protein [Aspergillus avenaceus]|uniref:Acyl-CoA binding protein n=1 Tax=Aspergillus avenaceus TaxID=36643 RepID=A0A5N6TIE5_ASPAV|nr:acyl-CoA binding protein [Aspergillus avenaceus]
MSFEPFYTALSTSQSGAKYTPDVQSAASGINLDVLKTAVQIVLAGGDDAKVEGDQAVALKAGFEFATKLVKMLEQEPGQTEMLTLYKYFKKSRNEEPAQPSFYQIESKYKYNAWKEISHISDQRAQALYIQTVNELIVKFGTRD